MRSPQDLVALVKCLPVNGHNISPDIMCLGKALTGGYMTLAATLCTEQVSQGICEGEAGCLCMVQPLWVIL